MFLNFLENRMPGFWGDFSKMRSDFLFGLGQMDGGSDANPPTNVYSNEDGLIVTMIVSGFSDSDIDVVVEENTLIVKGNRKKDEKEGFELVRREIGGKNFTRKIEIPFAVDSEKVEASLNFGILTVRLQKQESLKPKKVQVKVAV